jgi:FPC/CPF motif-containing protein YcgG
LGANDDWMRWYILQGSPFIILEGASIHSRQERLFVFVVVVVSVAGMSVGG